MKNLLNIKENFIVAVSGGPDSLALAFLTKIYSIKKKLNQNFLLLIINLEKSLLKKQNCSKNFKKFLINARNFNLERKKTKKKYSIISKKKKI